jgi:hypothetical protein
MPSPDANRVRIIGEELLPELECPQDPLPERLKILLELLDAAELRYRRTRERQGSISDDLRIEVEGEDLLVTLPGTSYAVKCSKSAKGPSCSSMIVSAKRTYFSDCAAIEAPAEKVLESLLTETRRVGAVKANIDHSPTRPCHLIR